MKGICKVIISLASDHAGFDEKQRISEYLTMRGHTVLDRGPENDDRVDYPDYALLVSQDVSEGRATRGILICGTGIGMAMCANKVKGIRAANVTSPEFAALCREHNDANVITLSARFVESNVNDRIVETFLKTDFGKGRHEQRVEKMMSIR